MQVKFHQTRLVSQTVRNEFSVRKNISLCHKLTELIHIYYSSSAGLSNKYTLARSCKQRRVGLSQRLHRPNIHLVNWKKLVIEMKLT